MVMMNFNSLNDSPVHVKFLILFLISTYLVLTYFIELLISPSVCTSVHLIVIYLSSYSYSAVLYVTSFFYNFDVHATYLTFYFFEHHIVDSNFYLLYRQFHMIPIQSDRHLRFHLLLKNSR